MFAFPLCFVFWRAHNIWATCTTCKPSRPERATIADVAVIPSIYQHRTSQPHLSKAQPTVLHGRTASARWFCSFRKNKQTKQNIRMTSFAQLFYAVCFVLEDVTNGVQKDTTALRKCPHPTPFVDTSFHSLAGVHLKSRTASFCLLVIMISERVSAETCCQAEWIVVNFQ